MVSRAAVSFPSAHVRCAGWLYQPDALSPDRASCVVMAHGTTGTMSFGLDPYARRFAEEGFVVLVFDYRCFGISEGRPRQVINTSQQLEDWRAALQYARKLPQVDPASIALWGTSLSAGHVLVLAGSDAKPAAVVAQLPFLGVDPHGSSPRTAAVTAKLFGAAVIDSIGSLLRRTPRTIPMVGPPGAVAVFTGAEDFEVASHLAACSPDWRNELAARSLWSLSRYRPARSASRVTAPLLICIAQDDTAASVPLAERAAADAPNCEVRHYPGGHFSAYRGDVLQRMITDQVDFLHRHLDP